jgi:predicted N-acetyltransferase YhbS
MAGLTAPRPLAADDERSSFDCGRESLNHWFRRHAWQNQQTGASRTTVVCDSATGRVAGYVSLSAAQIVRGHLPRAAQRNQPDPVPAILIGQLAVDRDFQGRGYAGSLLRHALATAVRLSRDVGCVCVLLHPLDDALRAFYARFGFETLELDPERCMVVRIKDLERAGF